MLMTRREFIASSAAVAATGLTGGTTRPGTSLDWGALLHLGHNMWDDFADDPDGWAKSAEEEATRPNPYGPSGKRRSSYHSYVTTREADWRAAADRTAADGHNLLFIDLGEAVAYPSHPELAVAGTWSVEKFRAELARLRALGLEPCPKLNFSSCHDSWLKDYHRMLSTAKYYQVVADVIRDVAEIFDRPRLFHIGYDEEMPVAGFNHFHLTVRQGDLWWHDLNYTIDQVTRQGSRPVMWADKIWTGRAEFLRRMTKEALLSNWYYRTDFSEKKQQWDAEFEKKGGWGETRNGVAAFLALEEGGFDQLPCCSNWAEDGSAEALVGFCREHIDPVRLKGFYTAPWSNSMNSKVRGVNLPHILNGLDLLKSAREKHYRG